MDEWDRPSESYEQEVAAYRAGKLAGEPAFDRPSEKPGSATPLTDAADDKTMSYNVRFERVRDLCRELEAMIAAAQTDAAQARKAANSWKDELTALQSATERSAAIEECARVCDEEYRHYSGAVAGAYADAAARIRRLDRTTKNG